MNERDILFRGKFGNEWKYGYLSVEPDGVVIKEPYVGGASNIWHVDPATIGQYTGFTDKNGTKIFEGDILEGHYDDLYPDKASYLEVLWARNGWYMRFYDGSLDRLEAFDMRYVQVVGNIYDNPKLLQYADNDTAQGGLMPEIRRTEINGG